LYDLDIGTRYWFSSYRFLDMQIFVVVSRRERYMLDAAAGSSRRCQSSSLLSRAWTSALKHIEHEGAGLERGPTRWTNVNRMSAQEEGRD